jgi:hypothetical protein
MIDIKNSIDAVRLTGEFGSGALPRKPAPASEGFQKILDETITHEQYRKSAGSLPHRGEAPVDKKLMDVCIETESIFVARMLKEMRKTVPKGEFLHGGFAEEIFEDMLYDEYALSLSKTANLGLAKTLYNELSRK